MRKRLRKKRRLGEFREFGFEVSFRLASSYDDPRVIAFADRFIDEAIEAAGLICGGGCGGEWSIFVSGSRQRPVSERDQNEIRTWLEREETVADIHIGPLVDAWHPPTSRQ